MIYYRLQIAVPSEKIKIIDKILGVKTNNTHSWELQHIQKEDECIHFINYFLSILDGKYNRLEEIGVTRDCISVWMIYGYDSQCNMEFSPEDMYCLGKEGIVLCISCYDIHDYDFV
jgi:hypothetical protein